MSSDESDHEAGGGRATYLIREKAWRAPALVAWLRVLDSLHLYMRYNGGFLASQGGWPHYRQGSDKKSDKPAVRRLPLACYSNGAIEDPFERRYIGPLSIPVNLTHPDRILTCVAATLNAQMMTYTLCSIAARYDLSSRDLVTGHHNPLAAQPQVQ